MKYFLGFRDLCTSWTWKEKSFCLAFTCSCMLCLHPFLEKPFAYKTKSQMKSLLQLSHFCVAPAGKRFHYSSGLLDLFSTEFTMASNYQVKLISCSSLSLYYFTMLHHIYRNLLQGCRHRAGIVIKCVLAIQASCGGMLAGFRAPWATNICLWTVFVLLQWSKALFLVLLPCIWGFDLSVSNWNGGMWWHKYFWKKNAHFENLRAVGKSERDIYSSTEFKGHCEFKLDGFFFFLL